MTELVEAVRRAAERHTDAVTTTSAVVVEPYVDGPEMDANIILMNGEVLFFDVSDDFPSKGDAEARILKTISKRLKL